MPSQTQKDGYDLYGVKYYKPREYEYEKRDDIFLQLARWLRTGERIRVDHLVEIAKENAANRIKEIKKWREENPKFNKDGSKRSRPKIRTNWMCEFRKLVVLEMEREVK